MFDAQSSSIILIYSSCCGSSRPELSTTASVRRSARTVAMVFLAPLLIAVGCGSQRTPSSPEDARPPVVVAAGDIADCHREGDEATARLVGGFDDSTVLTLGDNVYPDGSAEDFEECYEPTWGRFKART